MAATTLSRRLGTFTLLAGLAGCAGATRPSATSGPVRSPAAGPSSVRAVRTADASTVSIDDIAAQATPGSFVFFGEQHDDPETHFAELALLDAIGRRNAHVVLSLEMFERDVQAVVDDYLAGRISDADFLANSRPWPNYATDYRPLVVLARARGWPVVAANIPRPIASAVSRKGLAALDTLPAASRAFVARDIQCPHDAYYDRFAEQMKGHGGPGTAADMSSAQAMTDRFYEAQCVKDETMAESIVAAREKAGRDAIVVHFNGAFHSDNSLGTVSRVLRRQAGAAHIVISAMPVADPSANPPAGYKALGQFVILTRKPAPR